jgi:hypothetical protein
VEVVSEKSEDEERVIEDGVRERVEREFEEMEVDMNILKREI